MHHNWQHDTESISILWNEYRDKCIGRWTNKIYNFVANILSTTKCFFFWNNNYCKTFSYLHNSEKLGNAHNNGLLHTLILADAKRLLACNADFKQKPTQLKPFNENDSKETFQHPSAFGTWQKYRIEFYLNLNLDFDCL